MTTTDAARTYYRNIQDLRSGRVTPDQHRAINRELREAIGDDEWDRAKVIALSNDQRVLGY